MGDLPPILFYLTIAMAAWGAILSTILAILGFLKGRRSVVVSCWFTEQQWPSLGMNLKIIGVKAVHSGHRPVTLEDAGFRLSGGQIFWLFDFNNELPITLKNSDSVSITVELESLKKDLGELNPSGVCEQAMFIDSEGNEYTTRRLPEVMLQEKLAVKRTLF